MMATVWYSNSTGCTATSSVWVTWVSADHTGTTTATTTNDDIWHTWTTSSNSTSSVTHGYQTVQQLTAEQIRAANEAAEVARKRAAEEAGQRKLAAARAAELLRANLSQKQREALDKHGWFLVEGGKTKKTYRIHGDRCAGNIYELDKKNKEVARYCVHADYSIPLGDQLLAQALSLWHDEDHIIGKANKTALAA